MPVKTGANTGAPSQDRPGNLPAAASAPAGYVRSPINGALMPLGAHPGNTGGKKGRSGRPPSVIRERCRGSFEKRIKVLEEIADDPETSPADRIRAIDLLARYGLGTQQQVSGAEGGAPFVVGVMVHPGHIRAARGEDAQAGDSTDG